MADDNGEIYKDKLALVQELAKKIGKEYVVVQCPVCGMPHEKVPVNELNLEIIGHACSDDCRNKLVKYALPARILI